MSDWKEHIGIGLFSSIVVFALLYYFIGNSILNIKFFLSIPLIIIYYLLPDIDSSGSKISKIIYGIILISVVFCGLMYFITDNHFFVALMIVIAIFGVLMLFLAHRGFTHSILCAILFSIPISFINKYVFLLCLVGYMSHLIIDGEVKLI